MLFDVVTTEAFTDWLDGVSDEVAKAAIAMRIVRVGSGLLGNVRSVGEGVSELKVDVGQGYRVYFTIRHLELVVLLCGGTKKSQGKDIRRAKKLAAQLE